MIIKSITLNNFRQFKGEQTVEFSTDPTKNVTILLGKNTSGKTTLVQAFNWCLYEKTNFKTKSLLNLEESDKMAPGVSFKDVSVEIILLHENKEYHIKRTQRYSKTLNDLPKGQKSELEVSYKEANGQTQPIRSFECQEVVESILPEALSSYFFLDGEMIEEINNKSDVVAAVRGLMGLDVISSGMDHLSPSKTNSVISKFTRELDTTNEIEANKKKYQIEELKNQLENFETRKSETEEQIDYLKREKEKLNNILLENKDVEQAQREKNNLESDIKYLQGQMNSLEDRLKKDFSSGALCFFATPLIKKALKVISGAKQDGVGIPEMDIKSIDFILDRKRCICGCDLSNNQGAVNCIMHERDLLPPQHIGTTLRNYSETCQMYLQNSERYPDQISQDYITWSENIMHIDNKEKEFKQISEKIKGSIDVEKINQDYAKIRDQLNQKEELLISIRERIASNKTLIDRVERELNGLVSTTKNNDRILTYIEYAKNVYEWFKASYDKGEIEIKERLLEKVNDIFCKIYHGNDRKVEMNDNYKITLQVVMDGKVVGADTSRGLEGVKNFSFITGLIALAREKAKNINENESDDLISAEPYPLVMDAPFSVLDEIHISNTANIVPKIAEQVILIVMEKDWYNARENMEDRVGASYVIDKVDNKSTYSTIRRA